MFSRALMITPDPYKLWLLDPGLLLNYDTVILDRRDFNDIYVNKNESFFLASVHKNLAMLDKMGKIFLIDYKELIIDCFHEEHNHIAEKAYDIAFSLSRNILFRTLRNCYNHFDCYLAFQNNYVDNEEKLLSINHARQFMANQIGRFDKKSIMTNEEVQRKVAFHYFAKTYASLLVYQELKKLPAFSDTYIEIHDSPDYYYIVGQLQIKDAVESFSDCHFIIGKDEQDATNLLEAIVKDSVLSYPLIAHNEKSLANFDSREIAMYISLSNDFRKVINLYNEFRERVKPLIDGGNSHDDIRGIIIDMVRKIYKKKQKLLEKYDRNFSWLFTALDFVWRAGNILGNNLQSPINLQKNPAEKADNKRREFSEYVSNIALAKQYKNQAAYYAYCFIDMLSSRLGVNDYVVPDSNFDESGSSYWVTNPDFKPWYIRTLNEMDK